MRELASPHVQLFNPGHYRPVGWQPSRFLADHAETERAFQLAEWLGSVNAAAQELGTTWPSLPGNEAGVDCRDVDMTGTPDDPHCR